MKRSKKLFGSKTLSMATILFVAGTTLGHAGTLYVATDNEDFQGGISCTTPGGGPGIDRLAVVTTNGPVVISTDVICTTFLINGMADADGKLLAGTPSMNNMNYVEFDGSLISSVAAPGIPDSNCCNEEMLFVPQAGGGEKVYHGHYPDVIREIDPVTGVQIGASFPLSQIVGMALINDEIWVTQWGLQHVAIWDPSGPSLTVQAQFEGKLVEAYGALAWDPVEEVLWMGSTGGWITPFDLLGNQLGDRVQPLGAFGDTIDGMTFLGEVTPLTIDASIDIKFCSNPNGFNCKGGGVMPMTVFGSDTLDVSDIDLTTIELCLASDDTTCIDVASLRNSVFEDRGDPTTDIGTAQCYIDPDTGEQQRYLNQDGIDDLELAWNKKDVVDVLFDDCDGFGKMEASPTLIIKALTTGGVEVISTPVDDPGVDQIWKQNK